MPVLTLTDIQKVTLTVAPLDAVGNPAPIDGKPVWTVSDETLATLSVSEDGLTCEVLTVGPFGSFQVKAEADADLGEGFLPITGLQDFVVLGSQAVTLGITAGTPVNK
jgi:hypothetical protein